MQRSGTNTVAIVGHNVCVGGPRDGADLYTSAEDRTRGFVILVIPHVICHGRRQAFARYDLGPELAKFAGYCNIDGEIQQ